VIHRQPAGPEPLEDLAIRTVRHWWHGVHHEEPAPEGPRRNRRLTALAGLLLIPVVGLVVATGGLFEPFWRAHYFFGILVLPISALKLSSTGYRALRYYLGHRSFREAGPPLLPMRLLAPVLVVSLLVVSVTGVQMWLVHSQGQPWSTLHSASATIFILAVGAHALFYLPPALGSARAELTPPPIRGRTTRGAAVVASLAFGLVLASGVAATAVFPSRQHERGSFPPGQGVTTRPTSILPRGAGREIAGATSAPPAATVSRIRPFV